MEWKTQIMEVHEQWFKERFPNCYKDGHYLAPKWPDVKTSNGLTRVICDFLNWSGHVADRISSQGQAVVETLKFAHGGNRKKISWRPGSGTKGKADIAAKLNLPHLSPFAIPVDIEVKCLYTKDKMSEAQKKEKERVEKAGGIYIVAETIEGFLEWYNDFAMQKAAKAS